MARLLALDIGEKRIGVAISDETCTLARPLQVIERGRRADEIETLRSLLTRYQVETVIVGYPRSLSGAEGPQALQVKRYVERLSATLPVRVIWWDERYSTREATERLRAGGRRPADKGQIDAAAAAVILQDYLDARATMVHRRGAEHAEGY